MNIADYGNFIDVRLHFRAFEWTSVAQLVPCANAFTEEVTQPHPRIFLCTAFASLPMGGGGGVTKKKYVVILLSTRVSGVFFFIVSLHHGSEFV